MKGKLHPLLSLCVMLVLSVAANAATDSCLYGIWSPLSGSGSMLFVGCKLIDDNGLQTAQAFFTYGAMEVLLKATMNKDTGCVYTASGTPSLSKLVYTITYDDSDDTLTMEYDEFGGKRIIKYFSRAGEGHKGCPKKFCRYPQFWIR